MTSPSTPVTTRSGRPRRRELILDAAATLFAQRGFVGTGMDEIGVAAGITGPGVYRHFASKDELLKELVQRGAERLLLQQVSPLEVDETPEESISRMAAELVDVVLATAPMGAVIWSEQAHVDPELRAWISRLHRLRVVEWVHVLSRYDPDRPDLEWVTMVNGVYGMVIEASRRMDGIDRAHVGQLLTAMVTRALLDTPAKPAARHGSATA